MTENGGTHIDSEGQAGGPYDQELEAVSFGEYPRLPVTPDLDPERILLFTLLAVVFALPLAGLWRLAYELGKVGWAWWPG